MQVVEAEQDLAEHLVALDQVVEVGPGVQGACRATATRIHGGVVMAKAGVLEVPALSAHQGGPMATKPGGNHAIEQIKAIGHGNGHFRQGANAHEVMGFLLGQERTQLAHDPMHLLGGFADADAPDGNARQPHRGHHPGRFFAQVGVTAALNDAKEGLVALLVGCDAALQPAVGSPAGSGHIGFAGRIGGALVKGHGHIGPQGHLDLHGALGGELDAGPIPG